MRPCPKCSKPIHAGKTSHDCGWVKPAAEKKDKAPATATDKAEKKGGKKGGKKSIDGGLANGLHTLELHIEGLEVYGGLLFADVVASARRKLDLLEEELGE
jgi:hypothetical protein